MNAIIPTSRCPIATRVATMGDLPFLDALQKQHSKALGFFPRAQMEGYVKNGWVLVAEDTATHAPVGYCASRDRYLKRDELGVIYQLCVAPGFQRGLIGATLVKEVFARSAYGCGLYCCWCAQDLDANYFWESLGFVPIAFRAGSTGKKRVHIFWQRRIDREEVGGRGSEVGKEASDHPRPTTHHPRVAPAPYWYPCQTNAGAIREDRLVFPIPPGTHWTEVQAVAIAPTTVAALEGPGADAPRAKAPRKTKPKAPPAPLTTASFSLRFGPPPAPPETKAPKRERVEKPKVKIDPKLIAKSRELRDRYLEHVNGERVNESPKAMIAPSGKYDVSRGLEATQPAAIVAALPAPDSTRPPQPVAA